MSSSRPGLLLVSILEWIPVSLTVTEVRSFYPTALSSWAWLQLCPDFPPKTLILCLLPWFFHADCPDLGYSQRACLWKYDKTDLIWVLKYEKNFFRRLPSMYIYLINSLSHSHENYFHSFSPFTASHNGLSDSLTMLPALQSMPYCL